MVIENIAIYDYISDSGIPFLQILWLAYTQAPFTRNGKIP